MRAFQQALTLLAQFPGVAAQQPSNKSAHQSTEEKSTCLDEESVAEGSNLLLPGYMFGEIELENLDKPHYPFAHFVISYRPVEGVAHLVSQDGTHAPTHEKRNIGRLPDWVERVGFYKEGAGWSKLTLEDAKKIFGEQRLRGIGKTQFYTFDAFVTVQRERQLFHLDLRFDSQGIITSYRVRGIGIRNPQWISSQFQ